VYIFVHVDGLRERFTGFNNIKVVPMDCTMRLSALKQRLDLVAVMITVIIAGVVGYVGINIMSNTSETAGLGDYTTDTVNNTQWENTTLELHNGLESFFSQIGTVFIVIVLVVVIGYLMLLRGR